MTKMNITMTVIEVPAGKFNELIKKCTLACFASVKMCAILVFSFLVRWTNFLQLDVLKKLGKMQHHVSSFIDRCIDLYIAKMNIMMHRCTDGSSHP